MLSKSGKQSPKGQGKEETVKKNTEQDRASEGRKVY